MAPPVVAAGAVAAGAILLALSVQPAAVADDAPGPYAAGGTAYQANCAVCHGREGRGQPSLAPPLTGYPARYLANPEGRRQLAMTVLYGMYGDIEVDRQHYNFKMPSFNRLDDATLAAVLNFVAFDLAHAPEGAAPLKADDIAAERTQTANGDAVRQHRTALTSLLGL